MKRALIQLIIPHEETHRRAHSLSHPALFAYATFILLLQLALSFVANNFPGVLGFASNIKADEIIDATNEFRTANNLPALRVDERLTQAAQAKAAYMFEKNFWAHVSPDGTAPWKFVLDAGYRYLYAGENLAKDFQNSTDVASAWEASKIGHRENLLNRSYADIGVAVVNGVLGGFETTLVVQMFGSASAPAGEVSAAPPPAGGPTLQPVGVKEAEARPREIVPAPGIKPSAAPPALSPLENSRPLIPAVDIIALAKNVSYAFGFFLLAMFTLDGLVVLRRKSLRISGHNGAHILVLLLIIGSTFFLNTGTIR